MRDALELVRRELGPSAAVLHTREVNAGPLKRLVFGRLVPMPSEVEGGLARYAPPTPLPIDRPDRVHKVIYCAATLS